MTVEAPVRPSEQPYVFPPALVQVMRERLTSESRCMSEVTDEELVKLLTMIFFAGLDTYEGEHYPIRVVFVGRNPSDFVMTEGAASGSLPLYRWKILRFASPRPFAIRELVKLAVAGVDRRIYSAVGVLDDGALAIIGLAREGFSAGRDEFVKVIAARPGCLSLRTGHDLVLEYERGTIVTIGDSAMFTAGTVHAAVRSIAQSAGVDEEVIPSYLRAVGYLVREILAHGHGGILIISAEDHPTVPASAPYRMALDSSLATLLRLAWRAGARRTAEPAVGPRGSESAPKLAENSAGRGESATFGQLLHNAFLTEAERVVEELVRLTAIDGAVLLNRELALVAFGLILPVGQPIALERVTLTGDEPPEMVDLSSRGTRHRAAATYAAQHPGSVVFVASADGQLSCMFREHAKAPVRLWHVIGGITHNP